MDDISATIHISNTMQGCLWSRLLIDDKRYIYIETRKKIKVKVIGDFRVYFRTNVYLDLKNIVVVPSFRRN